MKLCAILSGCIVSIASHGIEITRIEGLGEFDYGWRISFAGASVPGVFRWDGMEDYADNGVMDLCCGQMDDGAGATSDGTTLRIAYGYTSGAYWVEAVADLSTQTILAHDSNGVGGDLDVPIFPYVAMEYDLETDAGAIVWRETPIPDAGAPLAMLALGMAGMALHRRR
jgi:hypothetical protein